MHDSERFVILHRPTAICCTFMLCFIVICASLAHFAFKSAYHCVLDCVWIIFKHSCVLTGHKSAKDCTNFMRQAIISFANPSTRLRDIALIESWMQIESNEALPRGLSNLPSLASTLLPQNLAPQISSLPLLTSGDDLDSNAPSRTLLPIRPTPTTPLNQRVSAAEKQAPSSELTLMVKKSEETEDASLRSEPSDVLLSSRNPAVAEVRPPFQKFSLCLAHQK